MSAPSPKKKTPPRKGPTKPTLKAAPEPEESFEMSDVDKADVLKLLGGGDGPEVEYHTLLQIWRDVLNGSRDAISRTVTPNWAVRMTTAYPQIAVQEMNIYRDAYFAKIEQLEEILLFEIETDPLCLQHTTREDDLEKNRLHYVNLIKDWQLAILAWEMEWDCTTEDAHIQIGAISEAHKFFFGPTGITGFLDQIGFQHTESDQEELFDLFNELREAQ